MLNTTKGHNFVTKYVELWFLFTVYRLIMLYICTEFHKDISKGYVADTISILKFRKGYNSVKNVKKLWFLIYIYCLTMLYFCIKFRKTISKVSQFLGN